MKDYSEDLIYNSDEKNSFAIEPEISSEFYYSVISNFYNDYKEETDYIYELLDVHNCNLITRRRLHDTIRDYYYDKLPVWENDCLSGGVHCVLFWDYSHLKEKNKEFKYKILNCPLHLKIYNSSLYSRALDQRCGFWSNNLIEYWSKWSFLTLKDELYSNGEEVEWAPIEFRCNNVFDERILWYYQGIILAVEQEVKFKKTSDTLRSYARYWDTNEYNRNDWDMHLNDCIWHKLTDDDIRIMRYNIKIILKLLREKWLVNSADKLKEYCNEYGIKYI